MHKIWIARGLFLISRGNCGFVINDGVCSKMSGNMCVGEWSGVWREVLVSVDTWDV